MRLPSTSYSINTQHPLNDRGVVWFLGLPQSSYGNLTNLFENRVGATGWVGSTTGRGAENLCGFVAPSFSGISGQIIRAQGATNTLFEPGYPFTFSATVQPRSSGTDGGIFYCTAVASNVNFFGLYYNGASNVFGLHTRATSDDKNNDTEAVELGVNYRLTGVWTSATNRTLYVTKSGGPTRLAATGSTSLTPGDPINFEIGGCVATGAAIYFNGLVGDCRYWSYALPLDLICEDAYQSLAGYQSRWSPLQASFSRSIFLSGGGATPTTVNATPATATISTPPATVRSGSVVRATTATSSGVSAPATVRTGSRVTAGTATATTTVAPATIRTGISVRAGTATAGGVAIPASVRSGARVVAGTAGAKGIAVTSTVRSGSRVRSGIATAMGIAVPVASVGEPPAYLPGGIRLRFAEPIRRIRFNEPIRRFRFREDG